MSPPAEPEGTAEASYEQVAQQMEEEVRNADFGEIAAAIGGDFEVVAGAQVIRLWVPRTLSEHFSSLERR